jgi:hypothetical protein
VTGAEHSSTSAWRRRRAALGWPQVRREGPGWRPRDDRGGATPDPDRVLPPEAATPARATLGEAGQQPPEHLPRAATSTAADRWCRSGCGHPGSARATASRGHEHGHLDPCRPPSCGRGPLGTASSWLLSPSPSPARIRTTGDLPRAVRAGCAPVAVCPPACRAWPLGVGPSVDDHAGGVWHVTSLATVPVLPIRSRRWRRRLALLAGPGRGRHPRGRRTSRQRPSLPALAWLPGQRWRPPRRPAAAFVSPAPPPTTCCRAVTGPESPIDVSGGATPGSPARRPQERESLNGGSLLVEPGVVEACVQARSQPATAAGNQHREQHGSGPGQTEDNQERSVPAHEAGPKRSSLHGMTARATTTAQASALTVHRSHTDSMIRRPRPPPAAPSPDP